MMVLISEHASSAARIASSADSTLELSAPLLLLLLLLLLLSRPGGNPGGNDGPGELVRRCSGVMGLRGEFALERTPGGDELTRKRGERVGVVGDDSQPIFSAEAQPRRGVPSPEPAACGREPPSPLLPLAPCAAAASICSVRAI